MRYERFGKHLKELRMERGLTQATVARWLDVANVTISRYESGTRLPTFLQYSTLMQKYGLYAEDYYMLLLEKDELYGYQNLIQLRQSMRDGKWKEAVALVREVAGKRPFTEGLYLQFLMFAEVMITPDISFADAVEKLIQALKITIADFDLEMISELRLSYNEITIIGEVASRYYAHGDYSTGIQILNRVRESMDKHYIDEREKAITYPILLVNLSCFYGREERHEEVQELCETAKRMALRYNNLRILPQLLYNLACALKGKGDMRGAKENIAQAHHVARAMEEFRMAEIIRKDAEENFGVI